MFNVYSYINYTNYRFQPLMSRSTQQTGKKTYFSHNQGLSISKLTQEQKLPPRKHKSVRTHIILQKKHKIWLTFYPSTNNFTQPLVVRPYLITGLPPSAKKFTDIIPRKYNNDLSSRRWFEIRSTLSFQAGTDKSVSLS